LVVLVIADELRVDAIAVEQDPGAARVLARDHVRLAERREDTQRHVLEVPDRRRAHDQSRPAGHVAARPNSSNAIAAAPIIPASTPKCAATIRTSSRDGGSARASISSR